MDWPRLLNRVVSLASLALVYYLGETGKDGGMINDIWAQAKLASPLAAMLSIWAWLGEKRERQQCQKEPNERLVDFIKSTNLQNFTVDKLAPAVSQMSSVLQNFAAIMGDVQSGLKVALTGHSLGAGCAIPATALLVALGIVPIRCAFFAPPRVGFKTTNDLVDQVTTSAYRNSNDPVTDVPFRAPPLWLYEQRPLRRGGPPPYRPPWEAHHIDNYVALEQSLNAAAVAA